MFRFRPEELRILHSAAPVDVFIPSAAKIPAAKIPAAKSNAAAAAAASASAPDPTAAPAAGGHPSSTAAGGQPPPTAAGGQPFSAAAGGQPPSTVAAPPTASAAAAAATAQVASEAAVKAHFEGTHGGANDDTFFTCLGATEPLYGMEVTTRDGRAGHLSFVTESHSFVGSYHPELQTRLAKMCRENVMVCVAYGKNANEARYDGLTSTDHGEWVALKGPFVQSSLCGNHQC